MEKVKQKVEEIQNATFIGKTCGPVYYGTSCDDIPYALLTTKGVLYAVRVIVSVKENVDRGIPKESILTSVTEHWTKDGADKQVSKCKEELALGIYQCVIHFIHLKVERLPKEAFAHPNNYIKPGDMIASRFAKAFSHYGIYIDNDKIVHFSGHGEGKSGAVARIGRLCPDFVNTDGTLWRIKSNFLFLQPKRVIEIAKYYTDNGLGEYNIILNNCQHFATFCAFGVSFSPEAQLVGPSITGLALAFEYYKYYRAFKIMQDQLPT